MQFLDKFLTIYLLLKINPLNGCRARSNYESTTSSPVFTYTYPSSGQSLVIESPDFAFANEKFTFFVLILTHQNSTFFFNIDYGDENIFEMNTTLKTIPISHIYSDVGLYKITVSIIDPFHLNQTKTIFVTTSCYISKNYL